MNFQSYLPDVVQNYLEMLLNGSPEQGAMGMIEILDYCNRHATWMDNNLGNTSESSGVNEKFRLHHHKSNFLDMRDDISIHVKSIKRLGEDERMRDAFSLLIGELNGDKQWQGFFKSALAARISYSKYRKGVKDAKQSANKIGRIADKLAQLIMELQDIELSNLPPEFFSVRHLLQKTDNYECFGGIFQTWRSVRPELLGKHYQQVEGMTDYNRNLSAFIPYGFKGDYAEQVEMEMRAIEDKSDQAQAKLHRVWRAAPALPALLNTLAEVAAGYTPENPGMVIAATTSNKDLQKTDYIRGFAHLLTEEHEIPLSKNIKKAIAIVGTVLHTDTDMDISYDDVRKAL